MKITIWLKKANATVYMGGDPSKGDHPLVTASIDNPQILVEPERNQITILETK